MCDALNHSAINELLSGLVGLKRSPARAPAVVHLRLMPAARLLSAWQAAPVAPAQRSVHQHEVAPAGKLGSCATDMLRERWVARDYLQVCNQSRSLPDSLQPARSISKDLNSRSHQSCRDLTELFWPSPSLSSRVQCQQLLCNLLVIIALNVNNS
jgi:hypothetical protein